MNKEELDALLEKLCTEGERGSMEMPHVPALPVEEKEK